MSSDNFQEDFLKTVKDECLIDVEIANVLEAEEGIPVGSRASLETVKLHLEMQIEEIEKALKCLKESGLSLGHDWLSLILNEHRKIVQKINKRLEDGDYIG